MKYYVNRETGYILIDENNYTPYLEGNGYEEITKEEYDRLNAELAENYEEGED